MPLRLTKTSATAAFALTAALTLPFLTGDGNTADQKLIEVASKNICTTRPPASGVVRVAATMPGATMNMDENKTMPPMPMQERGATPVTGAGTMDMDAMMNAEEKQRRDERKLYIDYKDCMIETKAQNMAKTSAIVEKISAASAGARADATNALNMTPDMARAFSRDLDRGITEKFLKAVEANNPPAQVCQKKLGLSGATIQEMQTTFGGLGPH